MIDEAKPHCGLSPNRSFAMYRAASAMRSFNDSIDSKSGFFVVTNPKMTNFSSGTSRNGSNDPERISSYSSSSRWA